LYGYDACICIFLLSLSQFDRKWRTSCLVRFDYFIAAVTLFYMRDYWANFGESPTFFRYVDWVLTVPLMCLEFYLILKVAGATVFLWKMIIYSLVMLVTGYCEVVDPGNAAAGIRLRCCLFLIVYEIWIGRLQNWQLPVETHLLHTKYYVGSYL
jgi:hypothetical protein